MASICPVWFSARLCLGDWQGWLFGSFGTDAGCLSWEVWRLRTGSTVLAILQSAGSWCRLLWERWLHPLHCDWLGSKHKLSNILSTCLDQFCWEVVDSSWLLFLQWLYCSLHFFTKDGLVVLYVCLETVQYWWSSTGLVIVQLRAVFCPSVQFLSFFCEAFSWMISDSSNSLLFYSGQIFFKHQLSTSKSCQHVQRHNKHPKFNLKNYKKS